MSTRISSKWASVRADAVNRHIKSWNTYGGMAVLDGESVFVKLVVREQINGENVLDLFDDSTVTPETEIRKATEPHEHPLSKQGQGVDSLSKDKLRA